jgi:hypothetical protein
MELEKEIIIYPSVTKLVGLYILSIIFVLIGALLIIVGFKIDIGIDFSTKRYEHLSVGVIGIISCLFFGLGGIYIIKRIFVRKPSVIISKDGFTDNASAISVGFLKWSEIKGFQIYDYMGQKFLGIEPIDIEGTLKKVSKVKRILLKMNKSLGTAIINIPQNTISMPLEEICDKMVELSNSNKY